MFAGSSRGGRNVDGTGKELSRERGTAVPQHVQRFKKIRLSHLASVVWFSKKELIAAEQLRLVKAVLSKIRQYFTLPSALFILEGGQDTISLQGWNNN